MSGHTVFLLSPAKTGGERADQLVRSRTSPLGAQLRSKEGAELGDVFAWLSALYFRGKLAYARAFSQFPPLVMAPGLGLPPAHVRIHGDDLASMATVDVSSKDERFVTPLRRDARLIARRADVDRIVILGSIASGKYTETLLDAFGERLLFPEDFVGRGDMSRGGLMLRAARSGEELRYAPLEGAVLRGKRPPRLSRIRPSGRGSGTR